MRVAQLRETIAEAERFIARGKALLEAEEREPDTDGWTPYSFYGSKASGAVRRASMDLTRSLADLRRP